MKIVGSLMMIVGCWAVGYGMCSSHRRQIRAMEQLLLALEWMQWELNCNMPVLSRLCRGASQQCSGSVSAVLRKLAEELEGQIVPHPAACMMAAMNAVPGLPAAAGEQLSLLGQSLGCFDLQGQLSALEAAGQRCGLVLEGLRRKQQEKAGNFQTLGICAGVALVILLL